MAAPSTPCPICGWLLGDGDHRHMESQIPTHWNASAFNAQFPPEFTRLYLSAPCTCGKEARRHPFGGPIGFHGHTFLRVLCNGRMVKL